MHLESFGSHHLLAAVLPRACNHAGMPTWGPQPMCRRMHSAAPSFTIRRQYTVPCFLAAVNGFGSGFKVLTVAAARVRGKTSSEVAQQLD